MMKYKWYLLFLMVISLTGFAQQPVKLQPYVLIVQPIVVQSDSGKNPASMVLPEQLVDRAYEKAGVDFHFLEPIFYNDTRSRDGLISLDEIVTQLRKTNLLKGQDDVINMLFVNAVDHRKGPLGRGMMGGNITFIALGDEVSNNMEEYKSMQAFVIAHEVGHNLSLQHAVDDPNVPDTIPNIQGEGLFKDRIDPKYSLNDYQINLVRKSPYVHPRVDFLSKKMAAKAILDEIFEPYFSKLERREITAFIKEKVPDASIDSVRNYAREKFASAVTDFTENEQKCISFVLAKVNALLLKNDIRLMASQPWRFIKVEDWLCGGFAHTRGTYIILSQSHIERLCKNWKNQMTPAEEKDLLMSLGGLFVHEQMHSLQRTYKSKFSKLYTQYWSFVHATVKAEVSIQKDQVSNPDAPLAEWLIPNDKKAGSFYWVRTLLKRGKAIPVMGQDFEDRVFSIEKEGNLYVVKKDKMAKLLSSPLSNFSAYLNAFPVKIGLDHPNEIAAYMFSEYFKALVAEAKPFHNLMTRENAKNTKSFMEWMDKEMN